MASCCKCNPSEKVMYCKLLLPHHCVDEGLPISNSYIPSEREVSDIKVKGA